MELPSGLETPGICTVGLRGQDHQHVYKQCYIWQLRVNIIDFGWEWMLASDWTALSAPRLRCLACHLPFSFRYGELYFLDVTPPKYFLNAYYIAHVFFYTTQTIQ